MRTRSRELKLRRRAQICGCTLTSLGPQNCNSSLVNNPVDEGLYFSRHALFLFTLCVWAEALEKLFYHS